MKIGIYCCSNGYGHFHRTLQVVENLEEIDVTIHCNEYQYKRFLDKLPKARYLFYDNSNIRWDNVIKENKFDYEKYQKNIKNDIKNIDDYDLVITDNIIEILRYRKDAIYSGSFLWFDVFEEKFGKNIFSEEEKKLFYDVNPLVVCNDMMVFGSLKNYKNKLDIGWGSKDNSKSSFKAETFCFIVPSLNYTEDYINKFLEIREQFKDEYNMSFNINHTENSVFIVRAGLGIINTCVSNKIPMICLYSDEDSSEIKFLSNRIQELGLGVSLNIKDDLKQKVFDFDEIRNNFKFEMDGYGKFSRYILENA